MKKLISIITAALISVSLFAQSAADSAITVTLTKQSLQVYAYQVSQSPNWDSRKIPDDLMAAIGTNTSNPDSLVQFTFRRGRQLANFINFLQSERVGTIITLYRQIWQGLPTLSGFTALRTQLNNMAATNTQQGRTAAWVKKEFTDYGNALDAQYADYINRGIDWIKN